MSEFRLKTEIDELINSKDKFIDDVVRRSSNFEIEGPTIGEQLDKISSSIQGINSAIDSEREERKAEDAKNVKYMKRMDRINLAIAIAGLVVAIIGVGVALVALK